MSAFPKLKFTAVAVLLAASAPAYARGPGTHVNDAKYYGPVYGWRYSPPPPTATSEPACTWATVRVMRGGHAVTRRVRRC